jgi:hypothetical protein
VSWDIRSDSSVTVGVSCLVCGWIYEGPDWAQRLAGATVTIVLPDWELGPVPLIGDQAATILVNGRPAVGVDNSGTAGVWPGGETWQRISDLSESVPLLGAGLPAQLVVEVGGAVAAQCTLTTWPRCRSTVHLSRTSAAAVSCRRIASS